MQKVLISRAGALSPRESEDNMKKYNVTVYIKREVNKGWEKEVYSYESKEEGVKGWNEHGAEIERQMRNKEIVTFQMETNFQV